MFKRVEKHVWAFDAEWVPDAATGRALYGLPPDMPEREVFEEMWRRNGASDDNPRPFLKLAICRVVSIAMVMRSRGAGGAITLDLRSQPKDPANADDCDERSIISKFLVSVGHRKPQLVGFNSSGSDLPIFVQRGIANGIVARDFAQRPEKPWDGVDYFYRHSDYNVDLMSTVSGWGGRGPKLNELAVACGIPGKIDSFGGPRVAEAWLDGDIARIVRYNEHDALTTYLVWLRTAHFAGHLPTAAYEQEQLQLRSLLDDRAQSAENGHLAKYIQEWDRLRALLDSSESAPAPESQAAIAQSAEAR